MSTTSQALSNPLVIVILTLALAAIGYKAWEILKKALAERREANAAYGAAMCQMTSAMRDWVAVQAETKKTLDSMATGTTKACLAIALATDKHRESVDAFSKAVFGQGGREDALQKPEDKDKNRIYREMEYISKGKAVEEARILAEQDEAHEESIQPGMLDGGS